MCEPLERVRERIRETTTDTVRKTDMGEKIPSCIKSILIFIENSTFVFLSWRSFLFLNTLKRYTYYNRHFRYYILLRI